MRKENWLLALGVGAGVAAITYKLLSNNIDADAVTVKPFNKYKYLGKWYEIARLPNRIEKDIKNLTEEYLPEADGTIKVITKGYNLKKKEWKEVSGKIKFAGRQDVGRMKVSYLGPFYVDYNVLDVDPDYQYALVSGSGLGYLWILSREKSVPHYNIIKRFLTKAATLGFPIHQLEWV